MFILNTPAARIPPNLDEFKSPEEKLKAIIAYLEISHIYCQVENSWDQKIPPDAETFLQVDNILIPGGQTSYIHSVLNEWLDRLKLDLNDLIHEDLGYETISEQLNRIKIICTDALKSNDSSNRLKFPVLDFLVQIDENWKSIPQYHLKLSQQVLEEIYEHLELRKTFFREILDHADILITEHQKATDLEKRPYTWDSEKAKSEIAELVHAIKHLRLKLNPDAGASDSKFRRDFYKLFGIEDTQHHQKLSDIRKKEAHHSLLHEFVEFLESSIQKQKVETAKNQP